MRSVLNIHWKDWYWSWNSNTVATWCEELIPLKRPWCWERLRAGEGDDRGWSGWMALPTRWTWVWVDSGSWWWTGRPGMLWFMGSQRVEHDWATELNWTESLFIELLWTCYPFWDKKLVRLGRKMKLKSWDHEDIKELVKERIVILSDLVREEWEKEIFSYFIFFSFIYLFSLQYCIGFAIHWHESAMGVHVFPILNPPPTSVPIPSLWFIPCTIREHPVSCIEPWLAIRFTYDNLHVSMPFSHIITPLFTFCP